MVLVKRSRTKNRGKRQRPQRQKPSRQKRLSQKRLSTAKRSAQMAARSFLRRDWRPYLAAAASFAIIQAVFAVLPKISVSTATTLGRISSQQHAYPFVVSNDSPFSIHSVEYRCFVIKAEFTGGATLVNELMHSRQLDKTILRPNEKDEVPCIPPVDPLEDLSSGDVELRVSFRPSFVFWRLEERFRFETYRSLRGQLHWLPKPAADENPAIARNSSL